jgi:uncharacterized membrane protein
MTSSPPGQTLSQRPFAGTIVLALAAAGALLFLLPRHMPVQTRALAAWNGAVITFLVLTCLRRDVVGAGRLQTAPALGYGKTGALAAVLIVCIVSVAATGIALRTVARHQPGAAMHANLSVLSVLSSWFLLQTIFALFYARHYYRAESAANRDQKPALQFAGDDAPDFWDFIYFSFTVGFSYATSDTNIPSRMLRRAVLLQAMISFLFYTIIIGLIINAILQIL